MQNAKVKSERGRLIVIEGSDGAGKATQLELLKRYLDREGIPCKTIDFPQYDSFYGQLIAAFLRGEYGQLEQVDPHLISVIYALDRAQFKDDIEKWLAEGYSVLANRYATSNVAHQSSRIPADKRDAFIAWLHTLEYDMNKIPREDIVIYLYVPYQISQELILRKTKQQRTYANGKEKDLVESNLEYLKKSEESYLTLVKKFSHWVKIDCVDKKGTLRSIEEIHREIIKMLDYEL